MMVLRTTVLLLLPAASAPVTTFTDVPAFPGALNAAVDAIGLAGSKHGVFTEALLKVLDQPGLNLVDMCANVQDEVQTLTKGEQVPEFLTGGDAIKEIPRLQKISLVAKAAEPEPAALEPATAQLGRGASLKDLLAVEREPLLQRSDHRSPSFPCLTLKGLSAAWPSKELQELVGIPEVQSFLEEMGKHNAMTCWVSCQAR